MSSDIAFANSQCPDNNPGSSQKQAFSRSGSTWCNARWKKQGISNLPSRSSTRGILGLPFFPGSYIFRISEDFGRLVAVFNQCYK
jgi:hypothetical protein